MKDQKRYMTPEQVAEAFSLNLGSLANMRSKREGPPYFKAGRRVLYKVGDVEKWIQRVAVKTTDSIK